MHRLVRQPGRPGDVADRIEPWYVRLAEPVDHDVRLLDLHTQRLKPEVLDIADNPDRQDHLVRRKLVCAILRLHLGGGHRALITFSDFTCAEVRNLIPCLPSCFSMKAEISASSTGRMRSSASTTVTSAPSVR